MQVVEYYRVSTQKQGRSGLGLEAQEAAVKSFITLKGADSIGKFIEIESGGNKDRITTNSSLTIEKLLNKRPQLLEAIRLAQREGATLVVKEPSRLSRFSLLINYLIACNIKFIAADNPEDNEFFIKLRTLFNEEELVKISERTKKALEARKARGMVLGNVANLTADGRKAGAEKRRREALNSPNNRQVIKHILSDRKVGKTLQEIAEELNNLGYKTARGKAFQTGTIDMLLRREAANTASITQKRVGYLL